MYEILSILYKFLIYYTEIESNLAFHSFFRIDFHLLIRLFYILANDFF
jgi:hypothetical protein